MNDIQRLRLFIGYLASLPRTGFNEYPTSDIGIKGHLAKWSNLPTDHEFGCDCNVYRTNNSISKFAQNWFGLTPSAAEWAFNPTMYTVHQWKASVTRHQFLRRFRSLLKTDGKMPKNTGNRGVQGVSRRFGSRRCYAAW